MGIDLYVSESHNAAILFIKRTVIDVDKYHTSTDVPVPIDNFDTFVSELLNNRMEINNILFDGYLDISESKKTRMRKVLNKKLKQTQFTLA